MSTAETAVAVGAGTALSLTLTAAIVVAVVLFLPPYRVEYGSRALLVGAQALAFLLAWTPLTVLLLVLANLPRPALVLGVTWLLLVALVLFGPGGPGRRWARRVADRVRDLGHRLVVQPAGAPA